MTSIYYKFQTYSVIMLRACPASAAGSGADVGGRDGGVGGEPERDAGGCAVGRAFDVPHAVAEGGYVGFAVAVVVGRDG